jgi:predicted DNA-binding protein
MSETIKSTVYLPEPLYERLRLEAFQTRESQTAIVIEALEKYFQEKDKPGE